MKILKKHLNKNYIFSFYFPYFIFISIIFNPVLKAFLGISYLYAVLILFGIIGMFFDGVKKYKNINNLLIYSYIIILFIIFFLQLFIYEEPTREIRSILAYTIMLIYWLVYFNKFGIYEFKQILINTIPFIYIIAIFGFIQYFFSPNLFGLIDDSTGMIQWAMTSTFQEYSLFLRASSFLGSPQVFGLFMALYIIIIVNLIDLKKYINIFGIIFLILSGMLSGNKSFFYIIIIYFLWKFFTANAQYKLKWIASVFFLIILIGTVVPLKEISNFSIIDRITNIDRVVGEEKHDSRVERYQTIIFEANPIIGNGLGIKTDRDNVDLKVAESYIFQILYEAGLFALLSFLILMLGSYFFADKRLILDIKILMILIFFSMIVVHAFNSPIFFIFFGIIVSAYSNRITGKANLA